jgi:Tat protein secretion system quality control protein TatD with DNase activity
VKTAIIINNYWKMQWKEDKLSKSSLKYITIQEDAANNPHNIWSSLGPHPHEVRKENRNKNQIINRYRSNK